MYIFCETPKVIINSRHCKVQLPLQYRQISAGASVK